jgi:signal transduction histidine kinase
MIYDEDERCLEFAPESLDFYPIDIPERANLRRFPINGTSIACRVARRTLEQHKMIVENIDDVGIDSDHLRMRKETRSELCISLVSSEEKLLGILVLERTQSPGFDQDDVALATMIARQLSLAIERAQRNDDLGFSSTVAAAYVWAADIAHDINSEFGKIASWAYLAQQQAEKPEKVRRYTQEIMESIDVLSMAGPWKNPEPQTLLLDETVEKHIRIFAGQQKIIPEFRPECPGIYIQVNPIAFQRVLRQLVRNASQAMVNTPRKKLLVRTQMTADDRVEIQLEDNGPGVDENLRAAMFRRPVTSKEGHGGYGLLITRQMIESMGGKIRLLPQRPNAGAVFSIKLPYAPKPEALPGNPGETHG